MEVYYKLTAPEYKDMLAMRTDEGDSYLLTFMGWLPFNLTEFFFDEGLFKDEYEIISADEMNKLREKYDKQIERLITGKAEEIANEYHKSQTDKGGNPYMSHIYAVVNDVAYPEEKIIAMFHDLLEDTTMTVGKLRQHRIPEFIISHVELLTHDDKEDYFDYINRLKYFPFAKEVKVADLKNNCDMSRLKEITEEDKKRTKKYKKALKILEK